MSDPRDEETVRRWKEYTQAAVPGAQTPGSGLPTVVTDVSDARPVAGPEAPSARLLGVLGLGFILVLAVGVAVFINGPGGGVLGGEEPSVNGRPAEVPETNGKPAPVLNLITGKPAGLIVSGSAPLQIGRGPELGERITSEAAFMVDGDPATAWRVSGDGTGQQVVLRLGKDDSMSIPTAKTVTRAGLINGFAKGSHYVDGRKILAVRWDFGNGEVLDQTLVSSEAPQLIKLPRALSTDRIELTITRVGPASTDYDDYTSISEVQIFGY